MSDRLSRGQNTLFNYFNKLPTKTNGNSTQNNDNNLYENEQERTKEKRQLDSDDENEDIQPVKRRKKIIKDSDSSDNESSNDISINDIKLQFVTPKKVKTQTQPKIFGDLCKTTNGSPKSSKKPTKLVDVQTESSNSEFVASENCWAHTSFEFLKPDKICDKNGKRPHDCLYDPRTIYVPQDFINKQTPAMQQWWLIKRDHFDCVLFFKVGKFYELYHMDAVTGVNELGFSYMKGDFAHSGFPESAYGRMVASLVELGYKVARVEQTETPDAMAKRLQNTFKGNKPSKVVSREVCQITNKGTRVQGLQDMEIKQEMSTYLLAIYENQCSNQTEFGVCFVDTSIGTFYLGQFEDDHRYSRLLTMLAQYPPSVILEERKQLNSYTKNLLKTIASKANIESLTSQTEFLTVSKTLKQLQENNYFKQKDTHVNKFPDVLQCMLQEDDPINTTCKKEYEYAIRCLGACLWYLKDCLLDIQLFSMGRFELYTPPDMDIVQFNSECKFMIMDSNTMTSLNILGPGQTLERTLNKCCTAMGKRLLHQWICKPMCNLEEIQNRQQAILELKNNVALLNEARTLMKSLPDLERLISRIHCFGNSYRAKFHPDSRAVLYEEKTYSKKKVKDFILTLNGFEQTMHIGNMFANVESKMLKNYVGFNEDGLFPDITDTILFFKNSFNAEEAEKEGKIIPQRGIDQDYDNTINEIKKIEYDLEEYLKSQQKYFNCTVNYFGTDKKRYQLDIPEHATHKANRNYFLEGTKKGSKASKRYTTNETKTLLARMIEAETVNKQVLQDINRRVFERFSEKYEEWSAACYCLAVLDVLLSLAEYANSQSVPVCVPDVLPFSPSPMIIIRDGVHPFIPNMESFVPNDIELGTDHHPNTLILTGPNMGGKSTLMRQVALLTIMAQLGSLVPATDMTLTIVDKIFTRMGAQDDIITGKSTFLVEMKEASAIAKHSTKNSLIFLDELGRGTATYDGTAIATSYVSQLIQINCRTIFSTHYYSLLDFFKNNCNIQLGHMACKVESEEDDIEVTETVIFKYKMIDGPCPKSFGFNAARLAGVPKQIISRGRQISQKIEGETIGRKLFKKLFCHDNVRDTLISLNF